MSSCLHFPPSWKHSIRIIIRTLQFFVLSQWRKRKEGLHYFTNNVNLWSSCNLCFVNANFHFYIFALPCCSPWLAFWQGALNKGWRNEAISAFHDRCRSIFYRFCALKYWYFPSQMERSWYFPSQIERSVAARAALEVTKWNAGIRSIE